MPLDVIAGSPPDGENHRCLVEYVEWVRNSMERAFDYTREKQGQSFRRQKKLYDTKSKSRSYAIGDLVWRWYIPKAREKLGTGWTGPYTVIRIQGSTSVCVRYSPETASTWVHKDDLKPYQGVRRD